MISSAGLHKRGTRVTAEEMSLSTTVIGSFPKPAYLNIPDWFRTSHTGPFTEQHNRFLEQSSKFETEETIKAATKEIIGIQAEAGLDVITDGEVRRESYILHFCRALNGFDFHNLFSKVCRDGAVTTDVPRIVGEVTPRENEPWVWKEWKTSQDLSTLPMKITLPGPVTIINSIEDQFYGNEKALGRVLAKILNSEIKALVSAGCKYIQESAPGDRELQQTSAMPLSTTAIGSFPKPPYLKIPDWFDPTCPKDFSEKYTRFLQNCTTHETEELVTRAMKETIQLQSEAGLDVITDGEMRRENYLYYFCRKLKGFDFHNLVPKVIRTDAATILVPQITAEVSPQENDPWVWKEWRRSQDLLKEVPMKITIPGPMTIADTVVDQYYNDNKILGGVLAKVINTEIKALVSAGCKYIQVDEPVMMRYPDLALEYGIDLLSSCFDGVSAADVVKTVHLCCGYPVHLDQEGYKKADKDGYLNLADKLDAAGFDEISIEDAHRHNDLSLFEHFKKSKIVLGSVKIASSRVESVDEIRKRLQQVLTVLPAERLIVAPDCGLGFLPTELARQKLCNMVQAAKSLP